MNVSASLSVSDFIARWEASGAAERANYQLFLSELCDVLGVERPAPQEADEAKNAYVFEKAVTFRHLDGSSSVGRIDLYKRGCFVLEAKQGSDRQTADEGTLTKAVKKLKTGTAVRGTAGWDVAMLTGIVEEGAVEDLTQNDAWNYEGRMVFGALPWRSAAVVL